MDATWNTLLILLAAWALWVPIAWKLYDNPMGNVTAGLVLAINWVYVRVWHRVAVEGREHIPARRDRDEDGQPIGGGPGLIVIANHTSGVDPMLIQYACPFFIRWMMTAEMRVRAMDILWDWLEIIFVGGEAVGGSRGAEMAALKETIRYLKAGGVVGIFPEGRLERPPGVLHPFQPGMGLVVSRTGAKVLPVVVTGTPRAATAWGSIWRPSRSRLRFHPLIDYTGWRAGEIVADLQKRYQGWTGWAVVSAEGAASRGNAPAMGADGQG